MHTTISDLVCRDLYFQEHSTVLLLAAIECLNTVQYSNFLEIHFPLVKVQMNTRAHCYSLTASRLLNPDAIPLIIVNKVWKSCMK